MLNANTGDVLNFSYVGYLGQNITVGSSNTLNISMQSDDSLEEVVVTALGIKRTARSVGYGITTLKANELNEVRATSSYIINRRLI